MNLPIQLLTVALQHLPEFKYIEEWEFEHHKTDGYVREVQIWEHKFTNSDNKLIIVFIRIKKTNEWSLKFEIK